MKNLITLLILLALPCAVVAKVKTHIVTVDGQECSECHAGQAQNWFESKHGLMGVKCVVCHGSPEVNFTPKPGMDRCRGCHGDAVASVQKLPARERTCFLCHEHHTAAVKESAKSRTGFHGQGGGK